MKSVILCGGKGRRIGTDSIHIPKALVQVGNRPLIMYTLDQYVSAGITEFVLCGGYMVKEVQSYFCECGSVIHQTDKYSRCIVNILGTDCSVEIFDTGVEASKADRIRKVLNRVADDIFFISYCDCISNVNIYDLLLQHKKNGTLMTLTIVNPVSRYGHVICEGNMAFAMEEKPLLRDVWINAGFIAVSPEAVSFIQEFDAGSELETTILPELARQKKLAVYRHMGFWRNIETQKDVAEMNEYLLR